MRVTVTAGEDGGGDADHHHDREAAHRAGAEVEEQQAGNHVGDVGIEDRGAGFVIAVLDRVHHPPPRLCSSRMRSLMITLASTAAPTVRTKPAMPGQGQRRERSHDAENDEYVQHQREIGVEAEAAVGDEHEDEDQAGAERAGDHRAADRILAEIGADGALLDHLELHREVARAQLDGELACFLHRVVAGDGSLAAQDRLPDLGRGEHDIVEDDRERLVDVLAGDSGKGLGAGVVEVDADRRLVVFVEALAGIDQLVAVDDGAALDCNGAAALDRQHLAADRGAALRDLRGIGVEIDQLEFEPRGLADQLLQPFRILDARHLHQDAVRSLADDRDFLGAFGSMRL
jgi:hypothetical protein